MDDKRSSVGADAGHACWRGFLNYVVNFVVNYLLCLPRLAMQFTTKFTRWFGTGMRQRVSRFVPGKRIPIPPAIMP